MKSLARGRGRRDERGQALVIALVFLSVFGLLMSFVLSFAGANLTTTSVVRGFDNKVFGADGGIEHGIQTLRLDSSLCATSAAAETPLATQLINGRTVEVTCKTISGSAGGANGFAVVTTETTPDSLQTQGAVGDLRIIEGPTYASGLSEAVNFSLTNRNGNLFERRSGTTCLSDADKPDGLTVAPTLPYHYRCTDDPAPNPLHDLPSSAPPAAPAPTVVGDCTTFYPGTYTTTVPIAAGVQSALTARNYFRSGLYYFENLGEIRIVSQSVVAGKAAPDEPLINGAPACDSDPADNGTGAKFVFGGDSRILADNPEGRIEIFSRCPLLDAGQTGDPCDPAIPSATDGTRSISVMAVRPPAVGGWMPSTLHVNGPPILAVSDGATPALTVHGLIYADLAQVQFVATNASEAQIRGGILAGRLILQSSASASGLVVSLKQRGVRQVLITATAKGVDSGEKDVVARAVIRIANDASRTVTIDSWRTA